MALIAGETPKKYPELRLSMNELAWVVQQSRYRFDRMNTTLNNAPAITGTRWPVAVAIMMAESKGNVYALNTTPPDLSYGLAQINMFGPLGPSRRAQFGLKSNEDLYKVELQAKIMAFLSGGGSNWRPWSTYVNGAYKKYMAHAELAVAEPSDPSGKLNTPEEKASAEQSPFEEFKGWVGQGVLRGASFIGGGALVVGGVVLARKAVK